VTKQLLFLTAVLVSLPMPILGNEAGFQTPASAVGFAPERFPTAVIFNESLAGARVRAYPTRHASGQNDREAWRYILSGPVIGNGESVIGSGAEQDVDVSGAHGLSSIVKIDDGAISISRARTGYDHDAGHRTGNDCFPDTQKETSALFSTLSPIKHSICSGLLTESTVWK